jgi:hypothetical protein
MSTTNVTPSRAPAKRPARTKKDPGPDVTLLAQAADLLDFANRVYDVAEDDDLRSVVCHARAQIERWARDNEKLDFSGELFDALGLLIMADMVLAPQGANLEYSSSLCDPYRAMLSAVATLLRQAVRKPTDD